ncbi:MAG: hypothetical protein HYS13_11530 [Planctomycetia bacterium]|nr:hypothetical protein [Planctomycetia bacterium]
MSNGQRLAYGTVQIQSPAAGWEVTIQGCAGNPVSGRIECSGIAQTTVGSEPPVPASSIRGRIYHDGDTVPTEPPDDGATRIGTIDGFSFTFTFSSPDNAIPNAYPSFDNKLYVWAEFPNEGWTRSAERGFLGRCG